MAKMRCKVKKSARVAGLLLAVILAVSAPLSAFAATAAKQPELKSISFKNAVIEENFSPDEHEYTLTLEDEKITPTLESYDIEGDANLFVTYSYDEAKHQTGAVVILEHENGSAKYNFVYKNAQFYEKSDNNYLKEVNCNLGVVSPDISHDTTDYKIYIPRDLTVLDITAATEDVGAYCDVPTEISLTPEQEIDITLTVTASNGDKRVYSFDVKRCDKSSDEVAEIIAGGNAQQLIKDEQFYQKPAFLITVIGVAGTLLILFVLVKMAKRLTVQVGDVDETEFFE